ncbi:endonuclease/exonuclease/phosphatase family protein [Timonella sp. A28]|uniref:endonuclease/exonuclease/phosphatase family protein n=1 Tax=Timonella sp. A28 TaxID=3442640 RepID=UPI003EB9100E
MQPSATRTGSALTLMLIALVTLTAELVRFSGPLLDSVITQHGVIAAALVALVTYVSPAVFTMALAAQRAPSGMMLLIGVSALALARFALIFVDGVLRLGIGLATVSLSVSVLTIASSVASRYGGALVARGVGMGLYFSAALALALGTFDAVWRDSILQWVIPLGVLTLLVGATFYIRDLPARPRARGLWALGPVMCLGVFAFANPAFIASQAAIPLWASAVVITLGALVTVVVVRTPQQPVALFSVSLVLSVVSVFSLASWPEPNGLLIALSLSGFCVALGVSAVGLLCTALERPAVVSSSWSLMGASASVGGLLIVPILLYQIDYDIPLGFPNELIIVGLALVFACGVFVIHRRETHAGSLPSHSASEVSSVGSQLVLVGSLVGVMGVSLVGAYATSPLSQPLVNNASTGSMTLVNWNVHYGVSPDGESSLDDIVDLIKRNNADLVTLQEVSRGWIMGGGADVVSYVAHKTGMEYAYVGAADHQFGNAILWKPSTSVVEVSRVQLSYGEGPQWRSAISGAIVMDRGGFHVVSAHLQHRDENTPTRLIQLEDLFEGLPLVGRTIFAGDFNAEPGWPEIHAMHDKGFASAIDVSGNPNDLTYPSHAPTARIDWIFSRDLGIASVEVLESDASDHLPIATTFVIPAVG